MSVASIGLIDGMALVNDHCQYRFSFSWCFLSVSLLGCKGRRFFHRMQSGKKKKIGVQLPLSPEPPDLRSQSSNVHESLSSLRSLPPYWLRYNSGSPLLSIIAIEGGTGGGAESYGHTKRGSGASTHECPIANGLLWGHSVWGGSQECRWGTRE